MHMKKFQNCRIISFYEKTDADEWETIVEKIGQLLNFKEKLGVQYDHDLSSDLNFSIEGSVIIKLPSGENMGQINYKITREHASLLIDHVSKETNDFSTEVQVMISNNLIKTHKPGTVLFTSEDLARANAKRLDRKLGRTQKGTYWGFTIPPRQI
jgi:hypothetical protein